MTTTLLDGGMGRELRMRGVEILDTICTQRGVLLGQLVR